MKIAIIGATGWIGSQIVEEARHRGHEVIALVRQPEKVTRDDVEVRQFDLLDNHHSVQQAVADADAVIAAVGGRAAGNHEMVANSAKRLIDELPAANVKRLLWVGGAGSLEVSPGVELVSLPDFPNAYKAEALAQGDALKVFRKHAHTLDWTFVSPAAEIFPGDKIGRYRVGADTLLTDDHGDSKISVADYAIAMIDELESGAHRRQRIGVAY
ncbi:NAD-dependent dehydratase [Salinivibrio kushneri]|uniref:NAD-dependent dehydratase n=1 Tax=Salinivibrio kushneri TaxID=1908198 RepID=A0AB36JW69_9GAMM|nr:NAD(P)-dependent oxidoreductase [Salinivibrio kushneri]OOE39166.1 NAD-dependent dehydratase [Salinivibrio kushneri]QCP01892.1 NAD(P)-dependent oxidoreductase [Salinivibrio kushneri]